MHACLTVCLSVCVCLCVSYFIYIFSYHNEIFSTLLIVKCQEIYAKDSRQLVIHFLSSLWIWSSNNCRVSFSEMCTQPSSIFCWTTIPQYEGSWHWRHYPCKGHSGTLWGVSLSASPLVHVCQHARVCTCRLTWWRLRRRSCRCTTRRWARWLKETALGITAKC